MVKIVDTGGIGEIPADLQKTTADAAAKAASTSKDSYEKIIKLPLIKNKKYSFWFTYKYQDPETQLVTESDRSPIVQYTFDIPNLTRAVINLTLTAGYRSYTVKYDNDPLSIQEDVLIYESLSGAFAGEEYLVYTGTSTSVVIQTSSTAQRWVKVIVRDRWSDENRSSATAGPVTPLNPDPDTTYTVANPGSTSASASIDPKDLSGFSLVSTMTWAQSSDSKTAGYAIRWSTDNPSSVANPLWEYASVSGKSTTSYTATGLIPNTTYYYQVASTTPYDVVSWTGAASGTFTAADSAGSAAGALARLKSFIAIGGATGDLFKVGTGIAQGINLNTEPLTTPTLTDGTYHGIILNKSTTNFGNNFWLTTGQFRVGNSTEFMYWNGTDLNLTGSVNATSGKFTGNVQLAIPTGGTTSGSLYAGSSATSGARLRFNNTGLYGYDGIASDYTVGITNAGLIDARKGYIGGWLIDGSSQTVGSISKNGTILDSSGNITLGDTSGTLASIVKLSSTDATYRLWVGSQTASNAPFRVSKTGILYATGAVISLGAGSTIDGYATTSALGNYTLTTTTAAINTRLTAVEGSYVSSGTLSTSLATKNSTFYTATNTPPSATKVGDLWINGGDNNEIYTATSTGTGGWTKRQNSTYAKTTDLNTKLNATTYVVQSSVDNSISMNTNGVTVYSGSPSNNGSNSGVTFNSAGIAGWKNGTPTFSILSDGTATFAGQLSAATGSFSGRLAVNTATDTAAYIDSQGTVGGVTGLVVGSIGFKNTTIGGWTSHCYPYWGGGANYDLGTQTYRWNDVRISGSVMVGHSGAANDSVGTMKTKLLPSGNIYANTLGVNSGTTIVQDSSGYMRVSSSSIRYKDNISYLNETGYLDIISQLKPATFKYKQEFMGDSIPVLTSGLIAEDVEEIQELNTIVNYNDAGEIESVSYDRLSAYLVLAIKEIKNRLDAIGA